MKVATSIIVAPQGPRRAARESPLPSPREVCARLGISQATARRDMRVSSAKKNHRTYGGALARFDATTASFADRRAVDHDIKARLAHKARAFIQPNTTCFFDAEPPSSRWPWRFIASPSPVCAP